LIVTIPFFGDVDDAVGLKTIYYLTLGVAAVYGTSTALLQVTLYGVAGPVPQLTVAFMVGIGLSSMLTNIVRIILHLMEGDPNTEAIVFFLLSTLFLAFCTLLSYKFLILSEIKRERRSVVSI